MATDKAAVTNIDNSDLVNFPNGRIKDNTGAGTGTPVNRLVYGDLHEFFAKLMRLAAITYNGLPDSEGNGYQLVDAAIALAGKNDFVTTLDTIVVVVSGVNTNVISVPLKLSTLKNNEALICKVSFDLTDQTKIKGPEPALQNVTVPSAFKNGDYVRFIKTAGGVTLIRLADALNLNALIAELNYLKAATESQEYAGASQAVATTPYTNGLAFFKRVCGTDSSMFLASSSRNGLLSAADKILLSSLVNPIKNKGWISGVDPGYGSIGSSCPHDSDITSGILTNGGSGTSPGNNTYLITFANAMANMNYKVAFTIESEGAIDFDNDLLLPVWKKVSTTTFLFNIQEAFGTTQSLKIHFEVIQL